MPIVLGMCLSINTFYGLSIGTIPSSTILFDHPISQAEDLRLWVAANRQYADTVISEKLYEKAYQSVDRPLNFQIRKISQILSLAETLKSFWVKAGLKMSDSQQCLYFLSCPSLYQVLWSCLRIRIHLLLRKQYFPKPNTTITLPSRII
ncbi:uncharacterized protein LOC142539244 isoform X2 [Primulina tabacum]|uniref:uncharacterized protein LOC142539244 isoform X2 n=1 Tax=Primulina tabacum TaxID=48773 RepID=UPI003F5A54E5